MAEYNSKSCNALSKSFYYPIEAALRWCGLIEFEDIILSELWESGQLLIPEVGQFPEWPCLRVNAEKIFDAIAHREIPCGRDGKTVDLSRDRVAKHRLTVRHTDLRAWMAKHYPDQKPEFLFDELERSSHSAINADSFRSLQADLQAARAMLAQEKKRCAEISAERDALRVGNDKLQKLVNQFSAKPKKADKREDRSDLHIIGALLETLMIEKKCFKSEEDLRDYIAEKYRGYEGCARRTMGGRFSLAKKKLKLSD